MNKERLESLFTQHGFTDFKWLKARDIRVAQWVRFKCLFGCPIYGKKGTCPPNVPSIEQCREFFSEYESCAVFHFEKTVEKPEDRRPWSRDLGLKLVKLEREVFLEGYYKAFLVSFDSCNRCEACSGSRLECNDKRMARPGADALGVDVYATVRSAGYHIQVLKNYDETMNRFAFLMVE